MTLLQYLRDNGVTGTKLGCGEGGCGACTVMVSYFENETSEVIHISVNACLTPLLTVDSCHVTTIEGIGSTHRGLHPVQERIAHSHGSQCGFCTPGITMALYSFLRAHPTATAGDIEDSLDGNLCRCTGYRPILDAAKSFGSDVAEYCARGGECCRSKSNGAGAGAGAGASDDVVSNTFDKMSGYTGHGIGGNNGFDQSAEPEFPTELVDSAKALEPLAIQGDSVAWYRPVSLAALLALRAEHPQAKLVVGNTEVGIETKFKNMRYPVILCTNRVPELLISYVVEPGGATHTGAGAASTATGGVVIGGSLSLTRLDEFCERVIGQREEYETRGLVAIRDMLRWFASHQIRNVACVAGNLVTASPIADLNPLLLASGALIHLVKGDGTTRSVAVADFFKGYRKVDVQPGEVLVSVFVPFTRRWELMLPFKQARRREDDISIVSAGIRVCLEPTADGWRVVEAGMAFGGMSPITIAPAATLEMLKGAKWERGLLPTVYESLARDLPLPPSVPGGQPEFRQTLVASFFFKFFIASAQTLAVAAASHPDLGLPPAPPLAAGEEDAATSFVTSAKPPSNGIQRYTVEEGGLQVARPVPHTPAPADDTRRAPVGEPLMHKSAPQQVSGEAKYTDDLPVPPNTLHAALVLSTQAHARLLSVDPSPAAAVEGFVDFFGSEHVPGSNAIGAIVKDEEVFASEEVFTVGQVIGVVVADTLAAAQEAARLVAVEYEPLPAVTSIDAAIAANSFYSEEHAIEDGDLEAAIRAVGLNAADLCEVSADSNIGGNARTIHDDGDNVVVEGEMRMGGQEHFYLETNVTLCIPGEQGEMEVFASTQNPTKTQNFVAHVCGVPASKVVARVKRMGGGFGGKETRSVFVSCAAAVAAHRLQRPVKIALDRDVDMLITGARHPFVARYRAAASRTTGRLLFADIALYSNGGASLDLSGAVMDRALFHSANSYAVPAFRVRGRIARTNLASNTAFRGFGGPQGMMVCEAWMDHLAVALGQSPTDFRIANLLDNGDHTPYGQLLSHCSLPRAAAQLVEEAELRNRANEVAQYNAAHVHTARGLAMVPCMFGINFTAKFMNQGGALVHVYTDGTVLISHGGTEMGQGLHTKVAQVAARAFNVPMEMVHVLETATDKVANSSPTAASMSADLYGMAVLDACEIILERLRPVAEKSPGADWKTLIATAFFDRVDLSAHGYYAVPDQFCGYDFNKPNGERGHPFNYHTFGMAAAEVQIDLLTGDVAVRRADVVMDVGNSLNPAIDIGQIEGAFVQGSGLFTTEELMWGDDDHPWIRPGHLFTRGPGMYKIPSFNDVPKDFRVTLMRNVNNPQAVHSSRAIGEPPLFLASAVFYAIKDGLRAGRARLNVAKPDTDGAAAAVDTPSPHLQLFSPATAERVRMAMVDEMSTRFLSAAPSAAPELGGELAFQAKGSW